MTSRNRASAFERAAHSTHRRPRFTHAQRIVAKLSGCCLTASIGLAVQGCPLFDTFSAVQHKPTVQAPADMSVECDGGGNTDALNAWLASATFTEGCGGASITDNFTALIEDCGSTAHATVTWTVTDSCGETATDSATFSIIDTNAPVLSTPSDIVLTCGDGASDALLAWSASAVATDSCSNPTITFERTVSTLTLDCTARVTWTATDSCGNTTSASALYTINGDTTAPVSALNGDAEITVECGSDWDDPLITLSDDCDALIEPTVNGTINLHQPGEYHVTYAAVDACGNAAPVLSRNVTVVDTLPPVVTLKPAIALWPPNHQVVALTLADLATVEDQCEGSMDPNHFGRILDVYSDEPDEDKGDGNTTGDITTSSTYAFALRAERQGGGNGRVYGVRFEVTDSSGNSVETTAFVYVPHDQSGAAAVDDGAAGGFIYVYPPD